MGGLAAWISPRRTVDDVLCPPPPTGLAAVLPEPTPQVSDAKTVWALPDGRRHRVGAPAVIYSDPAAGEEWWHLDAMHREDGPARVSRHKQEWWRNGFRHREDGPAVVSSAAGGTQAWYLHGQRHRLDGPAVEIAHGSYEWWLHGKMHRTDGPARFYANTRDTGFCVNGHEVTDHDGVLVQLAHLAALNVEHAAADLEMLLTAWRPDGPSSADLLAAIRTARA